MNYLLSLLVLITITARAEDKTFTGETEASAVLISGNANNETYSAKTKNTYAISQSDLATIFGKYIRGVSAGTENTKAWEAGLRYERVFTKDLFSGFLQQKVEHDPYNGIFIQRDSSDVGVKYTIEKTDYLNWFAEFGYRYQRTYAAMETGYENADFLRIYTEGEYKLSPTATAKLWLEHLPNLKRPKESQSNGEASLSVAISNIFSLKTAYLVNHNEAILSPGKKDTTTWTTALVAKY